MSVVVGFTIAIMFSLLGYMGYRLFLRRKLLTLIAFCMQVAAATIAILCFKGNVLTSNEIEAFYILFGVVVPGTFLVYDYIRMMKKFKEHGVYQGFLEHMEKEVGDNSVAETDKKYINPIIKECQIPELVKDLKLNRDDIIKNIKSNLSQAQSFIATKDYDSAYEIYDTLVKLIKNCPGLYFNLANICYYKEAYAEAMYLYNKVLEINKEIVNEINSPQESFLIESAQKSPGKELLKKPKSEADIKYNEYMIYYNLGNALFKLSKYEQAIDAYKKSLEINPGLDNANENIARSLIALNKENEAIEFYKKVLESDITNYKVHYSIGRLFYDTKDYDAAIKEYKECIRLNSSFEECYEMLGRVLLRLNKFDDAHEVYKKLISLNPLHYMGHYSMGTILYQMGQKEGAVASFKKAIEIKPDCYKSFYNMGIALDEMGEKDAALASFKKTIEIKADFIDAYNNLGILFSTQRRHLEALNIYTEGLKKNPEQYSLYYNMGITLAEMNRYNEAAEAYKSALEIKPDEYEISYHLGAALIELKKYNEAVEAYKSALKVKTSDSELYYNLATVYSLLKKHDIALDNLKLAIDLNSEIKKDAKHNQAFDGLKNNDEFKELVS